MGGTRDIYSSSRTFLAIFECEPTKVYAREDLKKELEHNQASDSRSWEVCDEKNTHTALQKRSAG